MCNTTLLLQYSKADSWCEIPKSFSRHRSHVNLQQALVIAQYFASAEESETVFCRFDLQDISEGPRKTQ
jgi:hypothetical protein